MALSTASKKVMSAFIFASAFYYAGSWMYDRRGTPGLLLQEQARVLQELKQVNKELRSYLEAHDAAKKT
ncbi:hypothetical protein PTKIN_Ptkin11bG0199400 [Pterospermum kingtungense]